MNIYIVCSTDISTTESDWVKTNHAAYADRNEAKEEMDRLFENDERQDVDYYIEELKLILKKE